MPLVTRFAMGTGDHTQQRDGNELILFFRFSSTDTRGHDFEIFDGNLCALAFDGGEDAENIFATKAGTFPEIPAIGIARQISEGDVTVRRRLLGAAFPARDGHSREAHPGTEGGLIEIEVRSQFADGFGPWGR